MEIPLKNTIGRALPRFLSYHTYRSHDVYLLIFVSVISQFVNFILNNLTIAGSLIKLLKIIIDSYSVNIGLIPKYIT